jgi:hypothetical protein
VNTLVIDNGAGAITDLVSFYFVQNTILGDNVLRGEKLVSAFLYFFSASTVPLKELVVAAARAARDAGAAVFNALPISTLTPGIMRALGAMPGDGELRYYARGVELGDAGVARSDLFIFPGV